MRLAAIRWVSVRLFVPVIPALALSCSPAAGPGASTTPRPTRGYVLVSIDTLRADHLGSYGYPRATSPFFDRLAAQGVLFENAYAQSPGTLPSHMSIFTGLHPGEHGVYPPAAVLSPAIETLPEVFQSHGFHTAGHTEGGYVHGGYGFARGFDEFSDDALKIETDIERTFARGLEFLGRLDPDERFFLFLHTYTVHDPYFPAEEFKHLFWEGPVPETFDPTGPNLVEVNRGQRQVTSREVAYFEALYDASIRYADGVMADFFSELETLGLMDETTVVITSDHGEEFREHGMLVHEQIYPECLHVPLLLLAPDLEPRRVASLVQSVDIAPTLYELAGIAGEARVSGQSFVHLLTGDSRRALPEEAFGEDTPRGARTIFSSSDSGLLQALKIRTGRPDEPVWVGRELTLSAIRTPLVFDARSLHETRSLAALDAAGRELGRWEVGPYQWTTVQLDSPKVGEEILFKASSCTVPAELGLNEDPRCLSVQLRVLDGASR